MNTRHALVTGGAGFIGSHLVDHLIERGFEVTVLDCLCPQVHGDIEKDAEGWPTYLHPAAHRLKGDLLVDGVFDSALKGVTHLVHLAASVGVGQSMTNVVDYTRNNVLTAAMVLERLLRGGHKVSRIAVASSMSIYGEGECRLPDGARMAPPLRSREQLEAKIWDLWAEGRLLQPVPTCESKPLQPASIYAINKRDHEEMFLVAGRAMGIPTVALRLFNAYGSRQALSNPYTGVAAIFIARLMNDRPPLIFEDGEQLRDFVHVGDVAEAFADVLEDERPIWNAFNVGCGRPMKVRQLAELLARHLGKAIEPEILNEHRVGDIRHCYADTSRFEATFGRRRVTAFEEGAPELLAWVARASRPIDRSQRSLAELAASGLIA